MYLRKFQKFLPTKNEFYPQHLDLNVNDKRKKVAVETLYNVFNDLVEMSNSSLIRNADHLLALSPGDNNDVVWIGESSKIFDSTTFKLSY